MEEIEESGAGGAETRGRPLESRDIAAGRARHLRSIGTTCRVPWRDATRPW